jgi:biotin carboxyl carrier protein
MTGRPLPAPWRLDWHAPQAMQAAPRAGAGRIGLEPDGAIVQAGERQFVVHGRPAAPRCDGQVEIDGQTLPYRHAWQGRTLWLHTPRADFEFRCRRREPMRASVSGATESAEVRAAINGRVIDIAVAPGDEVASGQRLLVLEAMKIEHELRAVSPGRVGAIEVRVGDQVAPGQILVRVERGS